jgi:hypothetical protein
MKKYYTLLNILDKIRSEATSKYSAKYNPSSSDIEGLNQARSRAFIHLFLKVSFGILEFDQREYYITDGTYDGGIDGYYINPENKTIYFIQSKFRTTEDNFHNKKINLHEILVMDINRILDGEAFDEKGNEYNGKIKQLVRDIQNTDQIARYKYKVILLANLDGIPFSKLKYLSGGYPVEIFDHEACYQKLVFPVISGTYFNASELNIYIDLSNKNAGSKISYTVQTKYTECSITVLFVPTIEIAKVLYKYKNSILQYNPRSYLELLGQKVNKSIRETILKKTTNEFALFNNGITMLSDDTDINEKIGQRHKAQLSVKNPQIINGGQTAYTLSRIYEENLSSDAEHIFEGKEVLLKIITLNTGDNAGHSDAQKIELIDEISAATNQQTAVSNADRLSNDVLQVELQKILFDRYGLLYERKRGEFEDGIRNGYIDRNNIIERNLFFRIYFSSNGNINRSVQRKIFSLNNVTLPMLDDLEALNNFYFGFICFRYLSPNRREQRGKSTYGKIYAMTRMHKPTDIENYENAAESNLRDFGEKWLRFMEQMIQSDKKHFRTYTDHVTQETKTIFSEKKWVSSLEFELQVKSYFNSHL